MIFKAVPFHNCCQISHFLSVIRFGIRITKQAKTAVVQLITVKCFWF